MKKAEVVPNRQELSKKLEALKAKGQKIVLADGCFDLLHVGHVRFLRAAKALGDVLVLAVHSDASVKRVKGEGRPLLPLEDRLGVLSAFEMIDFLTVLDGDGVGPLLAQLKPQIYAKRAGTAANGEASFDGQVVILQEGKDHTAEKLIQEILRKYGPLPAKN